MTKSCPPENNIIYALPEYDAAVTLNLVAGELRNTRKALCQILVTGDII